MGLLIAAVATMMVLGTVYAWSVYKIPLMKSHGWSPLQVSFTFSLSILFLGISASVGGRFIDRASAGAVARIAALLFGGGTVLAGVADQTGSLGLLWLGYGVIAGIGNGLAYLVPVAVLVRWFPDRKGTVTGFAVMGFGLGAAVSGQVAPLLVEKIGIARTFYGAGLLFFAVLFIASFWLKNPVRVCFIDPKAPKSAQSIDLGSALGMNQFYLLWAAMFLNILAGIALIGNLSPLAQHQLAITPVAAGSIIFAASVCNGVGRLLAGWVSEKIGRPRTFALLLLTQMPCFLLLAHISNAWMFTGVCCYIMLCYGGGFGTMPSFAADTFGTKHIGKIYGVILLAWGIAGGVGPLLIELGRCKWGTFTEPLYLATVGLGIGVLAVMLYKKPDLGRV
ncbi:MAG: hypothetical protein A2Y07_07300 [Planctomycetes bacterium GWF2_50_10]|nr:MAG: hypothetical protein A2Y07_07300 [Planctomycetes bacterium GWF2_50_10]